MDGRIQPHNLKLAGRDAAWLNGMLARYGMAVRGVYLANLDTQGWMQLQAMDGAILRFRAMEESEVSW